MSRTEERLQAKSELQEQVAEMIWQEMEPAAMVQEWDQATSDDRAVCLQLADWIITQVRTHDFKEALANETRMG